MNHTTIIGNVGRDADQLRYSGNGLAILKFTLADTSGKDDTKKTSWFDVVVFGDKAEACAELVKKGDRLMIVGRIQVEDYEKKDGTKGRSVSLVADEVARVIRTNITKNDPVALLKKELAAHDLEPEEPF